MNEAGGRPLTSNPGPEFVFAEQSCTDHPLSLWRELGDHWPEGLHQEPQGLGCVLPHLCLSFPIWEMG